MFLDFLAGVYIRTVLLSYKLYQHCSIVLQTISELFYCLTNYIRTVLLSYKLYWNG